MTMSPVPLDFGPEHEPCRMELHRAWKGMSRISLGYNNPPSLLFGNLFKAYTYHEALRWLMTVDDPSGRLKRWRLRLSEFDFTPCCKKGKENAAADMANRLENDSLAAEIDFLIPQPPIVAIQEDFQKQRESEASNTSARAPQSDERPSWAKETLQHSYEVLLLTWTSNWLQCKIHKQCLMCERKCAVREASIQTQTITCNLTPRGH